jgi:hypothetical protein
LADLLFACAIVKINVLFKALKALICRTRTVNKHINRLSNVVEGQQVPSKQPKGGCSNDIPDNFLVFLI